MSSHLESIVAEETAKRSQRAVLRCYAAEALFTWADLLTRSSKALFSLGVDTLKGTVFAADKTWRNVYFVAQQLNVSAFLMVLHLKWRQALAVFNTPTHTHTECCSPIQMFMCSTAVPGLFGFFVGIPPSRLCSSRCSTTPHQHSFLFCASFSFLGWFRVWGQLHREKSIFVLFRM